MCQVCSTSRSVPHLPPTYRSNLLFHSACAAHTAPLPLHCTPHRGPTPLQPTPPPTPLAPGDRRNCTPPPQVGWTCHYMTPRLGVIDHTIPVVIPSILPVPLTVTWLCHSLRRWTVVTRRNERRATYRYRPMTHYHSAHPTCLLLSGPSVLSRLLV